MKKSQFKGYILEEVLAYLIRTSGYTLITKAPSNDSDLINGSNGLNLRGRGATHQIDVLGELNWIPAFNFPLRLMVEAKFKGKPTGIGVIRDQVGILADVNENYFSLKKPKPRYHYNSVVFSTSGFTGTAIDMAVAHQVQLADLSDEDYSTLKQQIDTFTNNIFGISSDIDKLDVKRIREYLRYELNGGDETSQINPNSIAHCNELVDFVKDDYKELFIGMSKGGFMLLLKASDPDEFIKYAKNRPTHNIGIHWNNTDGGKRWIITPKTHDNNGTYELTFNLPLKLHKWIFETSENMMERALDGKTRNFSQISIYYYDSINDKNYIFNLKFDRQDLSNTPQLPNNP